MYLSENTEGVYFSSRSGQGESIYNLSSRLGRRYWNISRFSRKMKLLRVLCFSALALGAGPQRLADIRQLTHGGQNARLTGRRMESALFSSRRERATSATRSV